MSTPALNDAAAAPSLPLFLGADRLPLWRRALIVLGLAAPLLIWGHEAARVRADRPFLLVLFGPLLASLLLVNVNHAGAQLAARGTWWFHLLFGTVAAIGKPNWQPALIACGAGLALLAAWNVGLGEGERTRGAFEPVAFRRSLLVSITMATAEVQLLATGVALLLVEGPAGYAAGAGACAVLLGLGAYGLYRLKLWGVLLHLTAMVGVATLAASAVKHAPGVSPAFVWVATVSVQMLLPMPMLLAIVRRRPVRVGPPSAVPARLFATLVGMMMVVSALSGALTLMR